MTDYFIECRGCGLGLPVVGANLDKSKFGISFNQNNDEVIHCPNCGQGQIALPGDAVCETDPNKDEIQKEFYDLANGKHYPQR